MGRKKQKMAMVKIRIEENPRVMKALGREREGTTRLPDPSFVVIDGEASCGRKEGRGRKIGMREKGLICMKSIDG